MPPFSAAVSGGAEGQGGQEQPRQSRQACSPGDAGLLNQRDQSGGPACPAVSDPVEEGAEGQEGEHTGVLGGGEAQPVAHRQGNGGQDQGKRRRQQQGEAQLQRLEAAMDCEEQQIEDGGGCRSRQQGQQHGGVFSGDDVPAADRQSPLEVLPTGSGLLLKDQQVKGADKVAQPDGEQHPCPDAACGDEENRKRSAGRQAPPVQNPEEQAEVLINDSAQTAFPLSGSIRRR